MQCCLHFLQLRSCVPQLPEGCDQGLLKLPFIAPTGTRIEYEQVRQTFNHVPRSQSSQRFEYLQLVSRRKEGGGMRIEPLEQEFGKTRVPLPCHGSEQSLLKSTFP